MTLQVNGQSIETSPNGFLLDPQQWNEAIARIIADEESISLSDKHWDVINYLRDEFLNNGGNQPNTRTMVKALSDQWGEKIKPKDLYDLFPGDPSKQAGRIGGLPESRRKGGY